MKEINNLLVKNKTYQFHNGTIKTNNRDIQKAKVTTPSICVILSLTHSTCKQDSNNKEGTLEEGIISGKWTNKITDKLILLNL